MELDSQTLFNGLVTVATFFGGWILNRIFKKLDVLDTDVRSLPEKYVPKTDYREDMREVKDMLKGIYDKLDSKADKQRETR